jgi:IclR family acetate operon transcriptional repressor
MAEPTQQASPKRSAGVQSLQRTFDLLEHLADLGGQATLSDLAAATGLPLPTTHRLMRTLVSVGYVRQMDNRQYALGSRFIRLGEVASRQFGSWARPYLVELVSAVGETANLAVLDGDEVVYVAQAPSRHSVRMFTELGRRVPAHATGVGKAMMSLLPPRQVASLLARTGMVALTEHTITSPDKFLSELRQVTARGFALDAGEQELGVRCVAVPIRASGILAAVSVSGPDSRLTRQAVDQVLPKLQQTAHTLSILAARYAAEQNL